MPHKTGTMAVPATETCKDKTMRRPVSSRISRRYRFLAFYIGGFLLFLLISLLPSDRSICLFRNLTGLPCVGCGLTSGFRCILRLDFAGAWQCNVLSIPLFLALGAGFLWTVCDCVRKRDTLPQLSPAKWKRWQKVLFVLLLSAVFIGAWTVNLLRWSLQAAG